MVPGWAPVRCLKIVVCLVKLATTVLLHPTEWRRCKQTSDRLSVVDSTPLLFLPPRHCCVTLNVAANPSGQVKRASTTNKKRGLEIWQHIFFLSTQNCLEWIARLSRFVPVVLKCCVAVLLDVGGLGVQTCIAIANANSVLPFWLDAPFRNRSAELFTPFASKCAACG